VVQFKEKPSEDADWINGGYFVFEPTIFDYIENDSTVLEREPLENLTDVGQLGYHKHAGFWQPMDTLRDKNSLESLWTNGNAPWKVW